MSAWIVHPAHIDVLVLAGLQWGIPFDAPQPPTPSPAVLAATGAALWAEDHRSVSHRYGKPSEPATYRPPTAEVILDPVAVIKAIDCYVGQSNYHPGWPASRAADYCTRLRAAAMTGLPAEPDDSDYPVGWIGATWGITHLTQAAARTPDARCSSQERRR